MDSLNRRTRTLSIIAAICLLTMHTLSSKAQHDGCSSSYSRFGLGLAGSDAQTWNKSMGGVGVALPSNSRINSLNPASYAYIDSLSFIMDAGMSAGFGHMSQNGSSKNLRSVALEYVTAGFRIKKNLGFAIGFRPYTSIGYDFLRNDTQKFRDELTTNLIESYTQYSGAGGLNQATAGIGWRPFSQFSIGTDIGILWGSYTHQVQQVYTSGGTISSAYNNLYLIHGGSLTTWKLSAGAQYAMRLSPKDFLSFGTKFTVGHNIKSTSYLYRYMDTNSADVSIPSDSVQNAISIPWTVSGGIAWHHKNTLLVSGDFEWQGWGKCTFPMVNEASLGTSKYEASSNMYKDMYSVRIGTEFTPAPMAAHKYYRRIRYRAGFSYSGSYLRANNTVCPNEFTLSLGLGLPIANRINNRSLVNVGLQWISRPTKNPGMVSENYLMVNLGLTFNERWFMKFKIQ